MEIKIIKTDDEYEAALAELERLIDRDPDPNTPDGDRLELLVLVIGEYETEHFPNDLPDTISAIEFCMDQRDLSQKDLVPYIGSRSKVSEVLSGKRTLTLFMIRALNTGLGIPAEVLLQKPGATLDDELKIEWERFPIVEMVKRGWISASMREAKEMVEELITDFVAPSGGLQNSPILCRRNLSVRAPNNRNPYALEAWRCQVANLSCETSPETYRPDLIDLDVMQGLARLSRPSNGPILARDYLLGFGIILVFERHLPGTYLDGATFIGPTGHPVIGLTLRHDRIDNFWFTLMHELAHVWRHLPSEHIELIVDDLDAEADDEFEREADELAQEALIPNAVWNNSDAKHIQSAFEANSLADELKIHPAIVAGRIRHESKNYRKLKQMVGNGEVREMFDP
jgi:HTH-type transcriptional regulator/antitoxin HigA